MEGLAKRDKTCKETGGEGGLVGRASFFLTARQEEEEAPHISTFRGKYRNNRLLWPSFLLYVLSSFPHTPFPGERYMGGGGGKRIVQSCKLGWAHDKVSSFLPPSPLPPPLLRA